MAATRKPRPQSTPTKTHGGKHYLAPFLVQLAAKTKRILHRVETHGGGLSFTLAADPEGVSEVVNDTNLVLTNFWRTLQSPIAFKEMHRLCEATPFSSVEFSRAALASAIDTLDLRSTGIPQPGAAYRFFVLCRQSLAGRMDGFASISRNRTRRGMNEQASAWLTAIEGLPAVHARLKRILILCEDATKLIPKHDEKTTLFYCDPPYLPETRVSKETYGPHEMSELDHERLLETLAGIKGRFMLSGYDSKLYRSFERANKWKRHMVELPNNAAGGATKRRMTEVIWTNF
jgi:DNA adenine methylase